MRRIGTPTSVCPSRRFRFGGTLPLSPAGRTGRSTGCAGCRRPIRAGRCYRSRRSKRHDCLGRLKGFFRRPCKSLEQETACVPWDMHPTCGLRLACFPIRFSSWNQK